MPTTQLLIGPMYVLAAGIVYALPARAVFAHASAAIEVSPDGTVWHGIAGANTVGAQVNSSFIRSTAGANIVLNAV